MNRLRRGYTLIEAMMAILVLLIGLLGIIGVLTIALLAHSRASTQRLALAAAEARMDQLRRTPVASLTGSTFTVDGLTNAGGPVGTVTVASTTWTTAKKVTVRIVWTRPSQGDMSFETVFIE